MRASDPTTLRGVLAAMGETETAIAEGRVFQGRQRLSADGPVAVGDAITVHAARTTSETATILYAGDGLIVADKPASVPTIEGTRGRSFRSSRASSASTRPRSIQRRAWTAA